MLPSEYLLAVKAVLVILIVSGIYWFGFHVPQVLRDTQRQLAAANAEVENGKKAILLLDDIQKGKVSIDAITQKRISSLKAGMPHHSVVITGGMSLPSMR